MSSCVGGVAVAIAGATLVGSAQVPAQTDASFEDRLRQVVTQWHAGSGAPGVSVGVVTRDGAVFAVTAGVADRTTGTVLKPGDLMLAGSTGKTFFAALAVQLMEEKRLALDARVSTYLGSRPWFRRLPNADTITVRHLMTRLGSQLQEVT